MAKEAEQATQWTVGEVCSRIGVSVRTLHYYDEIGLLHPSSISEAGYRFYNADALARLQEILFFRELEFSLKQIAAMLARPDYDRRAALARQRELLVLKRSHLDFLLSLTDGTLAELSGSATLSLSSSSSDFKKEESIMSEQTNFTKNPSAGATAQQLDETRRLYAEEARRRWGGTPAYAESEAKHAARTPGDEIAVANAANAIFDAFGAAAARGAAPESPEVQALVLRWQAHISQYHYTCSTAMLACLGQMYTADERFAKNLDAHGAGTARLMSDAIARFAADHLQA